MSSQTPAIARQMSEVFAYLSSDVHDPEILRRTLVMHVAAASRRLGLTPRETLEQLALAIPTDEEWRTVFLPGFDVDERLTMTTLNATGEHH